MTNFDFDMDFTPHYAVIDEDVYSTFIGEYNNDVVTLAFHKGKVMTMEEYAEYHNEGEDINDHIEKIDLYDTCWEMCAECEEEVMLKTEFRMQVCPNCGKPIAPCNLCGGICPTPCPLGCN
jgi:predicted RNA-binding Zn-ribbon protein involved in translation (DUF1610 family)